jgi:hypothetical protein
MAGLNVRFTNQLRDMLRQKVVSGDLLGAAATMHKIREIIQNGITDGYGNSTEPLIAVVNHYYDIFLMDVPRPGDDVLSIYDRGGPSLTLVSLKAHMALDDPTKEAWAREAAAAIHLTVTDVHVV